VSEDDSRILRLRSYTEWTQARNRTGGKDPPALARFLATAGEMRLDQVSTFAVEKWKTRRAQQVKKATVNRELNIVRGCFSRAVDWDRLGKSPVSGVKPFRVDNTRLRILSSEEIERFLIGAPVDLALMARVTVEGLLRISEVLGLTRPDIKSDHLVLPHTKSGKMRKVPITSALRRDLLKRAHPSGRVFGEDRYDGCPPQRPAVTHAFRRTMARLGVEKASHHTLRHTGASVMLAGGVSIRALQEIGGWTSLRMLERYTHPTDAEKRRAVEITSRLTRVGTKTGTLNRVAGVAELSKGIKMLTLNGLDGVPNGIRTRVSALKGPYPGPLDDGDATGV
jgi:integrase